MDDFVMLSALAKEFQIDKSNLRKYILKMGITFHKIRSRESKGQPALAVSVDDANVIRAKRDAEGFMSTPRPVVTNAGVFYIMQLIPELDATRIKLGFAESIQDRLAQHQTSAPTAKLVKAWACKRSWEGTVIDCLVSSGCRLLTNEVYECDDIEEIIARGNKLFALLPSPDNQIELSVHSPYQRILGKPI